MTLHQIIAAARHTTCSCGVAPDEPCVCEPGSVHLSRVARARASGLITGADFASVITGDDAFTGATCVHDPEVTR